MRALALCLLLACSKDPPPASSPPAPAATATRDAPARPPDGCGLAPLADRLPAAARVVAIGDLHGDLAAARAALTAAGVLGPGDHWRGGATVVVQTGDVLDRGDDEPEILALLGRLEGEANAAGGALVALLGNHELMNAAGDLRYVTPDGVDDYGGLTERAAAFAPGGSIARQLAGRRVAVVVGDTLFAHAGPAAGDDLAAINRDTRCWLAGRGAAPALLDQPEGLVWTRAYGVDPPDCAGLDAALAALGVRRVVVGHTVQAGGVNAACGGKLWRIDVGMSRAYGGPIQVLELAGERARVVDGAR